MQILYCLSHQGSPQRQLDVDADYRLLDYRHRELITFPPVTLKREYSRAIYTTMVWNYVRERCGRYKAGAHLGNIHVKGGQSHISFLYWIIAFRLKICCCFLYKKKSFTLLPPPATRFSADLWVYWLLQKAAHHPLLLHPSDQASVTDYLMVSALVQTPILPSVSTTALVCTLLLEASSTWSTRLHDLAQHTPVQSSSTPFPHSLCSGCSLHLSPSGFALATLPGWNVLSP